MKKFLCFLGIFVLIVLIALPPTLRILAPEEEEVKEEKDELVIKALSCDGTDYVARTRYENDIVKMILIKKNGSPDNSVDDTLENPEVETEEGEVTEDTSTNPIEPDNSFEAIFTRLSEDSRVVKSEMEDGVSLTLDFSIYDTSDFDIEDLIKPINDQQIYYEDLGLTCSVIE